MSHSDSVVNRLVRAPFFLPALLLSMLVAAYVLASVSIGGWFERALIRLGWREQPPWLPPVFGFAMYTAAGVVGPIWLGYRLLGIAGAIAAPLILLFIVTQLDRW